MAVNSGGLNCIIKRSIKVLIARFNGLPGRFMIYFRHNALLMFQESIYVLELHFIPYLANERLWLLFALLCVEQFYELIRWQIVLEGFV